MTSRGPRKSGFTLLELILCTGMIALLSLSIYASLRIAFNARRSATSAVAPVRSMQIAIELVRKDLEAALPPGGVLAGSFIGAIGIEAPGSTGLEFYSMGTRSLLGNRYAWDPQDPTTGDGIHRVQLVVYQPSDGSGQVLLRRTTRNLLSPFEQPAEEEIVCRGVRTFLVRYFDGLAWQEEWDSTQQADALPQAVEVTLELDNPGTVVAGATAAVYRTSRVFLLPCAQPAQGAAG